MGESPSSAAVSPFEGKACTASEVPLSAAGKNCVGEVTGEAEAEADDRHDLLPFWGCSAGGRDCCVSSLPALHYQVKHESILLWIMTCKRCS